MVVVCGILEAIVVSQGKNEFILIVGPLALCAVYFLQLQVAKVKNMESLNSFLGVFFIPFILFGLVLFNDMFDSVLDNDAFEIFAAAFTIYANIFIPYGLAVFIAKIRKEPLKMVHFVGCLAILTICAILTMIIKGVSRIDIDDSLLIFPFELFPGLVDNSNEEGELYLGVLVFAELVFAGVIILAMLRESAQNFLRMCGAKEKQTDVVTNVVVETSELEES